MENQRSVELEMTYTTWEHSCKDPALFERGETRQCRRPANHSGRHASGFGAAHRSWK